MGRFARVIAALGVTALAVPAAADDAPIRASLRWTRKAGAESCLDDLGLRTAVESRLERAVFVPPAQAEMILSGEVEPGPAKRGWHVLITASDVRGNVLGEREVVADAGECNELVDSLALVMALAVDSSRRRIRVHLPAPTPVRPPPPPPPTHAPWRADLGPEASVIWGVMPGTALAGGLRATLVPPGFVPIDLAWAGYAPRRQLDGHMGADYVGWQASVLACPRLGEPAATSLSLCGGAQFGLLRATGVGLDVPRTATSRIGWLVARANLTWGTWRVRPRMGVTALLPMVRDRFVYDDGGVTRELYRPWPVGLSLDLGLAVRVP